MSISNKVIPIKGMHCRSCEILIEEELLKIPGVTQVNVSEKTGTAEIVFKGSLNDKTISETVEACGYKIGKNSQKWFSRNLADYYDLMKATLVAIILYFTALNLGLFNMGANSTSNYASYPVVFLVGVTAGFSTCMALIGGLVLGISTRYAESHTQMRTLQKLTPHLIFNVGRVFFFMIFGALIGYFGSLLKITPGTTGVFTLIAGTIMLFLGLQTLGIFPRLEAVKITLPKSLYKTLGIKEKKSANYAHSGTFLLGGLSFFIPCGFTQAIQLYAISTGNPITSAVTLGIFALGTTPGLLSIGSVTSLVKGKYAGTFFRFVGIAVIGLGIFNINNGFNLTGIDYSLTKATGSLQQAPKFPAAVMEEGNIQTIYMTQNYNGYTPNRFTVKKGVPVKWVVNSVDSYSCAAGIYSAPLGINQNLIPGENIIKFTPDKTGTVKFTCSMGMYTGYIDVIN
jgi:uncharacterized protein